MAIVGVDPTGYQYANTVQVDSDARDNARAIREIDDWAAENGFVRTNEYWLRRAIVGGKSVFRGICYRFSEEERKAAMQACQTSSEVLDRMPVTEHKICP
jgi:hypothetical protein